MSGGQGRLGGPAMNPLDPERFHPDRLVKAPRTRIGLTATVLSLLGAAGLYAPAVTLFLAGAGHGWVSAVRVCWVSCLTTPLAAVAWLFRRRAWGKTLALVTLATLGVADYVLFRLTQQEGFGYFLKVWYSAPGVVVVWFAAWVAPQALLAFVVLSFLIRGGESGEDRTPVRRPRPT